MADNSSDNNNLQLLRVNHSVKMTEAFETMFLDESLCDVSICCDGQVVKAHRVILAASSSYFKQILSSIHCQTQYPVIFLNGIQMPDLSSILEFIYRGDVTIPQTQLPSLVKSAEILGVSGLCQLDPNAQNISETQDKSRTSSPTDSTGTAKRGRKRKKLIQKSDNDIGSDSETPEKKTSDEKNGEVIDEIQDMDSSDAKAPTEKLAKSKLRSWTQQIAMKANHKDSEESQRISETESQSVSQQSVEESEKTTTTETTTTESTESTGNQQIKKHILKGEHWRHSRPRRPPLKYSEYTLPKGIQDLKPTIDKSDSKKETDGETDETNPTIVVRAPSPRVTRGRSRVHSMDDQKEQKNVTKDVIKDESIEMAVASTSADSQSSLVVTTPEPKITRSRKQTHSPGSSDGRQRDSEMSTQSSDDKSIKSEDESSSQQKGNKTPVKPQQTTQQIATYSKIAPILKWRPKDPELTTTKFTEKRSPVHSSSEELNYQYESIQADGPPVYRCSYCMHSFRSKQNIIDHIRSVHIKSEDRYVCPLCHKQFKWKTSLNNHLNQLHPHSRPTPLRHFDKSRKSLP